MDTLSYTILDIVVDTVQTENWTIIKEVTGKNVSGLPPPLDESTRVKESYLLIFTLDFGL